MRYFLCILVTLAWGLWFGGLVATFLFINRLFITMNAMNIRPIFDQVAPGQFRMSERFELVVGMFALLVTVGLWMIRRTRAVTWMFFILAVTAALAIFKATYITPKMLELIHPGEEPSQRFKMLHGMSMGAGTLEIALLLIVAAALPAMFSPPPIGTVESAASK
jgi:hypothetical protein